MLREFLVLQLLHGSKKTGDAVDYSSVGYTRLVLGLVDVQFIGEVILSLSNLVQYEDTMVIFVISRP